MQKDAVVEETRKAREEYAARFGFDLEAIYRDLKEQERKNERKVVTLSPKTPISISAD